MRPTTKNEQGGPKILEIEPAAPNVLQHQTHSSTMGGKKKKKGSKKTNVAELERGEDHLE